MNKQLGAVILCGGRSQRMGFDKASLPFGDSTFLEEVLKRVETEVHQVVLVGNAKQDLATFDFLDKATKIKVVFDQNPDSGPMEGIRVGLKVLNASVPFAFVTSCDVPLIRPELIPFLFSKIAHWEAVIPIDPGTKRIYGMTAIYRTEVYQKISELVQDNDLKVSRLAEVLDSNLIDINELKTVDPTMQSVLNINRLEDYRRLLNSQSLEIPARFQESN